MSPAVPGVKLHPLHEPYCALRKYAPCSEWVRLPDKD
jgi:hypothetical protein